MKDKKMDAKDIKDMMRHKLCKLRIRRNVSLRGFLINYVSVFVLWIISMTPLYAGLLAHFASHQSAAAMEMYMLAVFGAWKILAVVLFLVPALAMWWEMNWLKREHNL
ncbi:MAG: hypothetical protein FWE17_02010 [Alphaproteobacteria bacterium]|nr:hypothetical protein [Alphaproteobacteria bacterium]MCL2757762.1 hypothetical protein [Alphaproteobacteria bacterium]